MTITQRSLLFLKDGKDSDEFFAAVGQDDKDITIPASPKHALSRQERITVPYSHINASLEKMLRQVRLLNVRYHNKEDRTRNRTALFGDLENMDQLGLSVEVAPQKAKSFKEYKALSEECIDKVLNILRIQDDSEPIFFQEWFKKDVFLAEGGQVMVLRLWNALVKKNVELPVRLPDLESVTSVELVAHEEDVSLILYWDSVTRPTVISKKYVRQPTAELQTEVAVLKSMSPEPWEYNPPLSGFRIKIDRNSFTDDDKMLKFVPTMVYGSPTHHTLYGHQSRHEIEQPTGMHPTYKLTIEEQDSRFPFEPLRPGSNKSCSLMFNLEVPKQIILDKYQLEGLEGRAFKHVHVHNDGMDLELPSYRVSEWGGAVTIELDPAYTEFEIPLHFRYGPPLGDYEAVTIPKGQLYWQCEMDNQKEISETAHSFYYEPDRLGIDKLGASHVTFYHVQDAQPGNYFKLAIPTGDIRDSFGVEAGTLAAIVAGITYLVAVLLR